MRSPSLDGLLEKLSAPLWMISKDILGGKGVNVNKSLIGVEVMPQGLGQIKVLAEKGEDMLESLKRAKSVVGQYGYKSYSPLFLFPFIPA